MATIAKRDSGSIRLLARVTCPHCWERFAPEEVWWIAEHVDLLGDPRLGPDHHRRFLPSRFNVEGDAIDARGLACQALACPKCSLGLPRALMELEPLFLSILGAPASGKSYLLTTMIWQLRDILPTEFGLGFADADPAANRALNECEESLFLNPRESEILPLGGLIRKTELQGELYDTVNYGQQVVSYPRPFVFTLRPTALHPYYEKAGALARALCLYDNAGEHFQPGQDTTANPATRHLARSRALLFLFDPTQDKRFRAACRGKAAGSSGDRDNRLSRQETLLNEAAARVRKFRGLSQSARDDRPLIVILSKFDEWSHLIGSMDDPEPWRRIDGAGVRGLDVDRIHDRSARLRELLARYCPETVAAAEGFAEEVIYIAVSALGDQMEIDPATNLPGVRPANIRPYWATIPLLYALARAAPALIPRIKRRGGGDDKRSM